MPPSCSFTWPSLPALATVCMLHRGCPNCDAPPKPLELLSATCAARISLGQSYKKTSAYTLPYLYCSWLCTAITEYGRVRPCPTLALDGADSQLWVILAERAETSLVSHILSSSCLRSNSHLACNTKAGPHCPGRRKSGRSQIVSVVTPFFQPVGRFVGFRKTTKSN